MRCICLLIAMFAPTLLHAGERLENAKRALFAAYQAEISATDDDTEKARLEEEMWNFVRAVGGTTPDGPDNSTVKSTAADHIDALIEFAAEIQPRIREAYTEQTALSQNTAFEELGRDVAARRFGRMKLQLPVANVHELPSKRIVITVGKATELGDIPGDDSHSTRADIRISRDRAAQLKPGDAILIEGDVEGAIGRGTLPTDQFILFAVRNSHSDQRWFGAVIKRPRFTLMEQK